MKHRIENRLRSGYLRDGMRTMILEKFKPGDLLPPQAELCAQFDVGVGTLVSAMEELQREGLVVRRQGRGTFVTDPGAPLIGLLNWPSIVSDGRVDQAEKTLAEASEKGLLRYKFYCTEGGRLPFARFDEDRVCGLVTCGVVHEPSLRRLVKQGIRVVSTDWIPSIPGVDMVGLDSFRCGETAAETLIAAGHTRIAYIGLQSWDSRTGRFGAESDSELRLAGIRTAMLRQGLVPDRDLFVRLRQTSPFAERDGTFSVEDAYKHLFERSDRPTAIVYFDRPSAEQPMVQRLADAGLLVPRDLSAITIDLLESPGAFTTVGCPMETILRCATELLLARLKVPLPQQSLRVLVDCSVADRGTVAPPPAAGPRTRAANGEGSAP